MMIKPLVYVLTGVDFRGKGRLLRALSPKSGKASRKLFGYKVELDLADYMQRSIALGVYEAFESRTVESYLQPGMTVVDAGANIGYYSLLAASKGCTVHAFEPSPGIYKIFKSTVENNAIQLIHLNDVGLSDIKQNMRLAAPCPDNATPSLLDDQATEYSEVRLIPLDDYLNEHEINFVDLLKMDVEGFEPNVLRGAKRTLADGRIRAIMCEFNSYWLAQNKTTPTAFFKVICDLGFVAGKPLDGREDQTIFFKLHSGQ